MSNAIDFGTESQASSTGGVMSLVGATLARDSYKLSDYGPERRRFERRNVRYRAEARRMDNTLDVMRMPKFALTVLDISEGGIRATSRVPVTDGERLAIYLPAESAMPERVFGKVIRCAPRRDGWGLAIEFDHVPAA